MNDSQLLFGAYQEASKKLQDFIKNGIPQGMELDVKVLMSTITNYTRQRAVENNERQINSAICQGFASDKEEYKALVRANVPDFKVIQGK